MKNLLLCLGICCLLISLTTACGKDEPQSQKGTDKAAEVTKEEQKSVLDTGVEQAKETVEAVKEKAEEVVKKTVEKTEEAVETGIQKTEDQLRDPSLELLPDRCQQGGIFSAVARTDPGNDAFQLPAVLFPLFPG